MLSKCLNEQGEEPARPGGVQQRGVGGGAEDHVHHLLRGRLQVHHQALQGKLVIRGNPDIMKVFFLLSLHFPYVHKYRLKNRYHFYANADPDA